MVNVPSLTARLIVESANNAVVSLAHSFRDGLLAP
jgi:hypothetical protein